MRRIISFILIAILCLGVLTSCEQVGGVWDQVTGTVGGWFGLGEDEGTGLAEADTFLNELYSKKDGSSVTVDFDVVAQIKAAGKILPVTWTCDNDSIVIKESSNAGFWTVDLPSVNEEKFTFKLTATITDENGDIKTRTYSFVMLTVDNEAVITEPVEGVDYKFFLTQGTFGQKLYALATTQNNENKFINTDADPKNGVVFNAEKADGGYKFYTMVDGVKTYMYAKTTVDGTKISKYIGYSAEESTVFTYNASMGGVWTVTIDGNTYGVGTYGDYKTISLSEGKYYSNTTVGSTQFVLQLVTAEYANSQQPDVEKTVETPAANSNVSIKDALELGVQMPSYTTDKYYVTGTVTEIVAEDYGNLYIADDEGNKLYIYGTYDATGANRYDAMENAPKVGDVITVYGVIGQYSGTAQMKNVWVTAINGEDLGGGSTGSTELGIVDAPEAGTAYKFGLFHGNENATVYFNGQNYNNYSWYLAYSANVADAVDVYLEVVEGVEGGYRVYFMNGDAKTYIVAFPRDGDTTKGTLKLDTAAPAEYFTFDAEYNTLIYTSTTGEQFYLGSSGTYQSISCSAISFITSETSYIAHLYAEGTEGGDNGNGGQTPVDPNPDTPYAAPVEDQAYDLFMELPSGTVYFSGAMDGDYLKTTSDATASVQIYFEKVDGGYYIYFMNGETKTYITAAAYLKSNGYAGCHFSLTTETPTLAWTYDTTYGIIEIYDEIEGKSDTFFAGTYGTYSTVSLSGAYYKDQIASGTQYPARISIAGEGEGEGSGNGGNDGNGNGGQTPVDPEDGVYTIPEVLAAAAGTKVKFTGTVQSFYEDWSSYNNCSPYIVDEAGNKILVFRTTTHVYVGDVVTVEGTVTMYNAVPQIAQDGSVVTVTTPHTCSFSIATCTEASACTACGAAGADAALGHTAANADGKCDRCGLNLSVSYVEKELSFSSTDNRTSFDSSKQVWEANGVTLTNDKSSSTSNVADYSNPARFYKSSKLTVECAAMTKIEFVCNSSSYATALQSSIANNANYTVTVSGSSVIVTFVEAVDSFVIDTLSGGQVRVNSLTVTVIG